MLGAEDHMDGESVMSVVSVDFQKKMADVIRGSEDDAHRRRTRELKIRVCIALCGAAIALAGVITGELLFLYAITSMT